MSKRILVDGTLQAMSDTVKRFYPDGFPESKPKRKSKTEIIEACERGLPLWLTSHGAFKRPPSTTTRIDKLPKRTTMFAFDPAIWRAKPKRKAKPCCHEYRADIGGCPKCHRVMPKPTRAEALAATIGKRVPFSWADLRIEFDKAEPDAGRVAICCGHAYTSNEYRDWLEDRLLEARARIKEGKGKA